MHGTGTQAGDAQEIQSVTDVFAPLVRRRNAKQPLYIGAVKSNVGHGEAVAGTTALLKVLLMLEKGMIPPHVGIKNSVSQPSRRWLHASFSSYSERKQADKLQINPGFPKDLDKRNLHIPYQATPWPRVPHKRRIAVVNNFSAAGGGGGNTSIVVEEAPTRKALEASATDPRSTHLISVSAKSKVSLKGNLTRLIGYLEQNPTVSLADLSYTTMARRQHHNHRVAVATSDVAHLKKQLGSHVLSVDSATHKPIPQTGPPPVVFAFTGQGASYRSMDLELYRDSPYFRSQLLHLRLSGAGPRL